MKCPHVDPDRLWDLCLALGAAAYIFGFVLAVELALLKLLP